MDVVIIRPSTEYHGSPLTITVNITVNHRPCQANVQAHTTKVQIPNLLREHISSSWPITLFSAFQQGRKVREGMLFLFYVVVHD